MTHTMTLHEIEQFVRKHFPDAHGIVASRIAIDAIDVALFGLGPGSMDLVASALHYKTGYRVHVHEREF
jgi:hypothetical protein